MFGLCCVAVFKVLYLSELLGPCVVYSCRNNYASMSSALTRSAEIQCFKCSSVIHVWNGSFSTQNCQPAAHTYTHIHIHTHSHTHIYTHVHTHTHTHSQVDYMDTSRNQVVLKMIPRVDYTRKRGVLRSAEDESRKRKRRRPPAKLFDPEAIRSVCLFVCHIHVHVVCRPLLCVL